jgi:hypothetical protein
LYYATQRQIENAIGFKPKIQASQQNSRLKFQSRDSQFSVATRLVTYDL